MARRTFSVNLAINLPTMSASTRYDHVFAQDADEAVARAVASAEAEFNVTDWQLDAVTETTS